MKAYPETHQQGTILFENVSHLEHLHDAGVMKGDFGIMIAEDGRVWICIDGIAFVRFTPHLNGKMSR